MIEKQPVGAGRAKVTFRIDHDTNAERANVVGEFNDWSTDAVEMQRKDGTLMVAVELPIGRAYRFRYLLDGERWENDWAADAYAPNEYGGTDSVVDLTDLRV